MAGGAGTTRSGTRRAATAPGPAFAFTRAAMTVDGANVFPALAPGSTLFSLPRGFNQISMVASGTTSATRLTFSWRGRFLSP